MYISDFRPIRHADQLMQRAIELTQATGIRTLSVAVAQNEEVLEAARDAQQQGLARSILGGDEQKIHELMDSLGMSRGDYEVLHEPDIDAAASKAVRLADDGHADVLMKGVVPTATLLRLVLSREFRLRGRSILSHTAILDVPGYHKLLGLTDAGMVPKSDLRQRIDILRNAVTVMHALGISRPKVAMIAAVDHINLAMPVSMEAAIIAKMSERGQIEGAIVDGPMSFDMATCGTPADIEDYNSPVAGDADLLVVDTLETGNILVKSLSVLTRAVFGGVIVGARIPLSLVSRSDSAQNKMTSIALSILVADHLKLGAAK